MNASLNKLSLPFGRVRLEPPSTSGIMTTVALNAGTVGLSMVLRDNLSQASVHLLFLLSVLIASIRYGFWTGIVGSVLAFLSANFFFVEPLYSFQIGQISDWVTLFVLLVSGATTGVLVGRLREEADAAALRSNSLELMREFSTETATTKSSGQVIQLLVAYIAKLTKGPAVSLIPENGHLSRNISSPSDLVLTNKQKSSAAKAYSNGFQSPGSKPILDQDGFAYRFLGKDFGVIGFISELPSRIEIRHAYNSMIDQAIVTLEKLALTHEAEAAQRTAQREALRSALLSSLSHDLRTPLATILGGVSSLRELGDIMPIQARVDTLLAVEEEAGRLSRYVENLLHMTRLKTGLEIRKVSIDPSDVVRSGAARARRAFSNRQIITDLGSDIPLITADAVLLEQALFNLIDNAIKFSNSELSVIVGLSTGADAVSIFVKDQGVGIPSAEQQLVLDAFYRGTNAEQIGSGLGLAISNGIVSSLGGTIKIESPVSDGIGTIVSITIPIDKGGKS